MNSILEKYKINRISILFFTLLCLTQFNISFDLNIIIERKVTLNVSVIAFSILSIYLFYRIVLKKEYSELSKISIKILKLTAILVVYSIISSIINYFFNSEFAISITMTSYIIFAMMTYILIDLKKIKIHDIIRPIELFILIINFILMIELIINTDIRTTTVLGNINTYISFMLINLPVVISYSTKNKGEGILKSLTIVLSFVFFILAGSRFGIVGLLVECIFYAWINNKINKETVFMSFKITLLGIVIIVLLYNVNTSFKKVIERTFEYPIRIYSMITNSDYNSPYQPSEKSLTREKIYYKSLQTIRNNLLIGTGRPTVFFDGWGHQGAHNYILEILLCYGVLGGGIYISLAIYPIIKVAANKKNKKLTYMYLLSYIVAFFQSMFEPMLSTKMIILLCVYALAASIINTEKIETMELECKIEK
ncbi:MAG: O-antigen ligase family protein [Clostridia bacterium]|nr:O-antigen ligase family protein [Clostridia bacterium]